MFPFFNIEVNHDLFWQLPVLKMMPAEYVMGATLTSLVVTACLLCFTFTYLLKSREYSFRSRQAQDAFGSFLSDIILAESETELLAVLQREEVKKITSRWLAKSFGRRVLIGELMNIHRNMSGQAAENIIWLYRYFNLSQDTLKNFQSGAWYKKTQAIQEFAEMKQTQYLDEIYRETTNPNSFIRTEAQIALVKITGFEGLKFLHVVRHSLTQWQQLCLIQQLSVEGQFHWSHLPAWLQSENESVVEFALRLAENYKCYEVHNHVALCLQHSSMAIRRQALRTLKEICLESTAKIVEEHFSIAEKEEQLCVLEVLRHIGGAEQLPFLVSLLRQDNDSVKYAAIKLIQQWSRNWYELAQPYIDGSQSPLYCIITELKKEEAA